MTRCPTSLSIDFFLYLINPFSRSLPPPSSIPHSTIMTDDNHPTMPTPNVARPKPARSSTTAGVVRGRTSPTPGASGEQSTDGRPPTKRARKAINCEPCRNSKLKCDRFVLFLFPASISRTCFLKICGLARNRPCSSCVLRGESTFTTSGLVCLSVPEI